MTSASRFFASALPVALAGGCVSGSLASDTGPRAPGLHWSVAGRQSVHVGETVRFDFVLEDAFGRFVPPLGRADYCVLTVDGERYEADVDASGHFPFRYRFDRARPGQVVSIEAAAYRLRGGRDFMRIRGEWLQAESPYEVADQCVARARLRLTVYAAVVEMTMPRPPDDLDADTGVLRLRRSDGTVTSRYIDRPGRPGFTLSGPEPDGVYRVRYEPSGDELNSIGETEVEFMIYDHGGHAHHASTVLETP